MTDKQKQKVIDGLDCCTDIVRNGLWAHACIGCPYGEYKNPDDPYEKCAERLLKDAIEAIKG